MDLKPCPFCGNKTIEETPYHGDIKLQCSVCNVFILNPKPHFDWNDRPIEDSLRIELAEAKAERDRLKEALEIGIYIATEMREKVSKKTLDVYNQDLRKMKQALSGPEEKK